MGNVRVYVKKQIGPNGCAVDVHEVNETLTSIIEQDGDGWYAILKGTHENEKILFVSRKADSWEEAARRARKQIDFVLVHNQYRDVV